MKTTRYFEEQVCGALSGPGIGFPECRARIIVFVRVSVIYNAVCAGRLSRQRDATWNDLTDDE
jgi:hypothetical protein